MKNLNVTINFDMDGTFVDLYGVENWLDYLVNEDTTPYEIAKPLVNLSVFARMVNRLQKEGWEIGVITWLSKNATNDYNRKVAKAKREWLAKYNFPFDEIHLVAYGTTKANCTRKNGGYQVLVDDNAEVRKGWHLGNTINANENILEELKKLLDF